MGLNHCLLSIVEHGLCTFYECLAHTIGVEPKADGSWFKVITVERQQRSFGPISILVCSIYGICYRCLFLHCTQNRVISEGGRCTSESISVGANFIGKTPVWSRVSSFNSDGPFAQ